MVVHSTEGLLTNLNPQLDQLIYKRKQGRLRCLTPAVVRIIPHQFY